MTEIVPFHFEDAPVRLIDHEGAPWFVMADVCRILDYTDSAQAARNLDEEEVQTLHNVQGITQSRNGIVKLVSESGLYSLILTSRKPAAKRFKKWITAEVLPTLRRTGRYEMNSAGAAGAEPADPVLDQLTARELNAWTRYLETVRSLFDRRIAAAQYPKTPLPAISATMGGLDIPELDGGACLAHLLASQISRTNLTVGGLARIARRNARTREQLGAAGILVDPTNWRGWVAIAVSHPRLQWLFTDTIWAPDWAMALLAVKSARPAPDRILFPDQQRRAVLVPWDAVAKLLDGEAPEPARRVAGAKR